MHVLTIYANPNPRSFCHAVLERFSQGLADAGHTNEVVDLYAIGFNPVLGPRDGPNWMDENIPEDILGRSHLREDIVASARGPIRRFLVKRWLGDKDTRAIIRALRRDRRPRDILEQQAKVARAQGLVFIAPVWFVGFPAILKGWIERVFTLGFAFGLSADGWHGDIAGRIPLLRLEKALIINTTLFDERSYRSGLGEAMQLLIDDFCLRYPGIRQVAHEYFYAVHGADDEKRAGYLERAHRLGRDFAIERPFAAPAEAAVASRGLA